MRVGTIWWQSTTIYASLQVSDVLSEVTVSGGTIPELVSLPVNFDLSRLIPEFFLKTIEGQELVQALNNWIAPIWRKILDLKYLMDPDKPIAIEYLNDTFDNVGFPRNLILDLHRGIKLFKFVPSLWAQTSSTKFYEVINYLTTSNLNYKDLSESILYYSRNDNWSDKRYQDATYYREGAFSANVTESDIELINDIVSTFFTAGYFLYFLFSFGVEGSNKYRYGDVQYQMTVESKSLKYSVPYISQTTNAQQTSLIQKSEQGFSIIASGGIIFDENRWNIQ